MDTESDSSFAQALRYQDNPDAADKLLAVRFFHDDVQDAAASIAEGRPVFKRVECVEIRNPGERDVRRGPIKYMKPDPRLRFPGAYAKFRARVEQVVEGTLLREWGLIPSSRAREYEALNVFTVEQLAGLPDTHTHKMPGSVGDKQKAKDFLEMAKGQAPLAQARAEAEALKAEIAALRDALKDQGERIEKLTKKQRKAVEED